MKTGNKIEKWRFGLLLVLFCLLTLPQLAGAAPGVQPIPTGPHDAYLGIPDYYTTANWANSPPMAKFVDTLPGLTPAGINNLGQYLPIAEADTETFPGSDYYIIKLVEYERKLHSDLNPTRLRGYVQLDANGNQLTDPHYLGPVIVATKDRPVRLKFINGLPTGEGGDLFLPVDESVMGAGPGPITGQNYTHNRANIHLHGGRTPWISDGTPHQWITPAGETTPYKQGVSLRNVPDMCFDKITHNAIPRISDPDCLNGTTDPGPGATTYYFTNQQSTRLMFYHDHAFGITRLNVYAGMAAGYVITDAKEQDLIDRGIVPGTKTGGALSMGGMIPLIIQDKTFVNADVTVHPGSGSTVQTVRDTDPLWNWGSCPSSQIINGIKVCQPVTGDLWMPHVYMPAQLPEGSATGGVNPYGRWMYGPWFYPATAVTHGPKPNPYYDPKCSSLNPFELAECQTPGQPQLIPGTPNVSMGMEAFQDSVVVNGTAFPTLTVDPKPYRFRILNAASDRFQNLSWYVADSDPENTSNADYFNPASPKYRPGLSNRTEVKMAPASPSLAAANNWPADWPVDGREEMVPDPGLCKPGGVDCPNLGPDFIQIGTEGGFLPFPDVRKPQPVTYITDPTAFWVGVVDKTGLALGPAERADVIVDFSKYAGKTLILYNDAPAAWPARVPGYDYYTGAPDMRDSGGYGAGGVIDPETGAWVVDPANPANAPHGILPGYAPNTRTVMQVIVKSGAGTSFDQAALENEFTSTDNAEGKTLFERTQEPIIVGQAAYSSAYPNSYFPSNFPWEGVVQINDEFLKFVTVAGEEVYVPTEPKGIHDEMGASFDPEFGRMSGNLSMQLQNATTLNALLVLYGFSDLPTETVDDSASVQVQVMPDPLDPNKPKILADGTQIWKISHNGVDTHPIHFHIFDVQLINRVGWDGQIAMPEPNELGWKDTIKISPLMDTIVAVRPRTPALPFGIPNSLRPLNPAIPIDDNMQFGGTIPAGSDWFLGTDFINGTNRYGFNSVNWITGEIWGNNAAPIPYPQYKGIVTNILYDFGWEYVWHCHILSHEEMDMMRPIVLKYPAVAPPAFAAQVGEGNVVTWNDPTPVDYTTTDIESYRKFTNEVGFNVYRSADGTFATDPLTGKFIPNNTAILPANTQSYAATGTGDYFVVEAFNAGGSTFAYAGVNPLTATVTTATAGPFTTPGPITLVATPNGFPAGVNITNVAFFDGTNLLGTVATPPYEFLWNSATAGSHDITAKVYHDSLGGVVVSNTLPVVVDPSATTLDVAISPPSGTFGVCGPFQLTANVTTSGTVDSYVWSVNGVQQGTGSTFNPPSPAAPGSYPVTLTVTLTTGESASVTNTYTITNTAPTATIVGGPYDVPVGSALNLVGSGADADTCQTLAYGWDVDGKAGYEFTTATPIISYNALASVLGGGVHPLNFKVTDPNGAFEVASTFVTVQMAAPTAITVPAASVNGDYTVSWSGTTGLTYVLEEATSQTGTYSPVYTGTAKSFAVTGKTNGSSFWYRVKAIATVGTLPETAYATSTNACTTTFIAINAPTNVVRGVPTTITVTLPPAPTGGSLSKVEFYSQMDTNPAPTFLGSSTVAPYSFSWTPAINVYTHKLTAKAFYTNGAVSTSAEVVINPGMLNEAVTLTSPANGSVFGLGSVISLTAAPVDNGIPVSAVVFYDGATIVGTDDIAPFSLNYTPTTGGIHSLTAKAFYANGAVVTSSPANSITIVPPAITPTTLPNGAVNVAYSKTMTATGGTVPYTWVATGLPSGLSINPATGEISGTPDTIAVPPSVVNVIFPVTFTVQSATTTLNLRVNQTLPAAVTNLVATAASPTRVDLTWTDNANNENRFHIQRATNSTFTAGIRDVFVNATSNLVSYTDTTVVNNTTYYYRVRSGNVLGWTATFSNSATVTTPIELPRITTTSLPNASVNVAYSRTVAATSGTLPYTWSATGLPVGLSINNSTGEISGIPAPSNLPTNVSSVTFLVSVTVTDSALVTATRTLELKLNQSLPAVITGLSAVANSPTQIVLTWTDTANNDTRVQIDRATNNSFTTGLKSVFVNTADVISYTDNTVSSGTTYFYRVRYGNFLGWTAAFSAEASATTP